MILILRSKIGKRFLNRTIHHVGVQFLGFSDDHFSFVENVHHLSTGNVLPHYHLVFVNLFEKVFNTGNDALFNDICNWLFDCHHNF